MLKWVLYLTITKMLYLMAGYDLAMRNWKGLAITAAFILISEVSDSYALYSSRR